MKHALVIGGGPAGLMAADVLARAGHRVTVADQMPSFGRKFLMAGKSGLNLTKAEPIDAFLSAFGNVPDYFKEAVRAFGPEQVQAWSQSLEQPVFTGSTGRVFPTSMKASPLLRAWLTRLERRGVVFRRRWRWDGWAGEAAVFQTSDGVKTVMADATVLACGGKSWAKLGSDGAWADKFANIAPFKPANCGFEVKWTDFMTPFFGAPVKATALHAGDLTSRGEWVITRDGIEGGGIYEVSAAIRETGTLDIDLMPDVGLEAVQARLSTKTKKASRQHHLRQTLRLPPVKEALFNEFSRSLPLRPPEAFARAVKALPIPDLRPYPIDGAISTAGGVPFASVDRRFMLRSKPGVFVAGEMLDWEARTGGYLITGCLATGQAAGQAAARWIMRSS